MIHLNSRTVKSGATIGAGIQPAVRLFLGFLVRLRIAVCKVKWLLRS
jgi:hypothetical protein